MTKTDKIVTHSVDMQTAGKFTVSRKLKTWLRNHPNFERSTTGKYTHIYEQDFIEYQAELQTQQRDRNNVQQPDSESTEQATVASGSQVSSGDEQ